MGEQDVFLHSETVKFIKLSLLSELAWGQADIFLLKCSDQKKKMLPTILFGLYFAFFLYIVLFLSMGILTY